MYFFFLGRFGNLMMSVIMKVLEVLQCSARGGMPCCAFVTVVAALCGSGMLLMWIAELPWWILMLSLEAAIGIPRENNILLRWSRELINWAVDQTIAVFLAKCRNAAELIISLM